MNITTKDLYNLMYSVFSLDPRPRKIKITSKFNTYLDTICQTVFEEPHRNELARIAGTIGRFDGITIEIDDTIENEYYELVY